MAGEPVSVVVEEKLLVSLNKDGGVESMEVQGIMSLQARARRPGDNPNPNPVPWLWRCQTEPSPPAQTPARATWRVWFDAGPVAGCLHAAPPALRALAVQQGAPLHGPAALRPGGHAGGRVHAPRTSRQAADPAPAGSLVRAGGGAGVRHPKPYSALAPAGPRARR